MLTSRLLSEAGFRHAFFTRRGGVSEGPYWSLNCSFSVGDDPARVEENLARAAAALDLEPAALCSVRQVHGRAVAVVRTQAEVECVRQSAADALITVVPGIGCAVRVADCVPVLLGDRATGAVAAVHAGWRGLVEGVLRAAVEALRSEAGEPGDLVAAIGPHISVECFEVSEEVARLLGGSCSDQTVLMRPHGQLPRIDLGRVAYAQLRELGLGADSIDLVAGCTASQPDLFFSFRRDGPQSGRQLAAIVARAPGT